MPILWEQTLRLAAAIVFASLALVVWNVGSRSPRQLFADARLAFSSARAFAQAFTVTALGAIFSLTSIVLLMPIFAVVPRTLSPLAIGSLLVALTVDFLIGRDLRTLVFRRENAG